MIIFHESCMHAWYGAERLSAVYTKHIHNLFCFKHDHNRKIHFLNSHKSGLNICTSKFAKIITCKAYISASSFSIYLRCPLAAKLRPMEKWSLRNGFPVLISKIPMIVSLIGHASWLRWYYFVMLSKIRTLIGHVYIYWSFDIWLTHYIRQLMFAQFVNYLHSSCKNLNSSKQKEDWYNASSN